MERRKFLSLGASTPFVSFPYVYNHKGRIYQENKLYESAREIPIAGNYEVIVCGAGPAGISAAIEAARTGGKVLLIEANGCLGGVWTAGLLTWILDQSNKKGIMREIEKRLIEDSGVSSRIDTGGVLSFDPEIMKLLLEQMCLEAGVDIILHSRVVGVVKNEYKKITHVITESKSGREAWSTKVIVDTSGDGDVSALAGCGFDFGRQTDNLVQPFSLLALVSGISFENVKEFSRWKGDSSSGSPSKRKLLEEIIKGGVMPSYLKPGLYPIRQDLFMLMANHEYGFSPLNAIDVTRATLHARQELNNIINGLRSLGEHWSNIRLVATAEQIGTREGRRIHGIYTLTENDLIKGAQFKDAICDVTFGVDVHSLSKHDETPKGEEKLNNQKYNKGIKSKPYQIPLRSLIAKDVGGIMMAGRCISGDFIAHSSYRVTGNAVAMGQAAGRVSSIAAQKNLLPNSIAFEDTGL